MTFAEISAWDALMGHQIRPQEVQILRAMDQVRTRIWNTKREEQEPDNLIDVRDSSGIAGLLRGLRSS